MRRVSRTQALFLLLAGPILWTLAPAPAGALGPSVGLYGGRTHGGDDVEGGGWAGRGDIYLPAAPFLTLGAEYGDYRFAAPADGATGYERARSYGGVVRLALPTPMISPYLVGGLGLYRWEGQGVATHSLLGMSAGLGLEVGATLMPVKFALEGRWHGKAGTDAAWRGRNGLFSMMAGVRVGF